MISGVRISLLLAMSLLLVGTVSAATISDDLHLNLQTTYSNGSIETGTFDFVFNISNTTNCAAGNIVYTNSTTLTTDTRGIISYYLPDVTLDYDIQYYLCYYRDGSLKSSSKIAKTPYSFRAMNITLSGIEVDTNFDMTGYNITADTGFFSWLGNMANRVTKIFVQDLNFSGEITGFGNVSANWFKGQFNWTESSDYLAFDGSQLDFNETKLNETISLIDASSNYWTQSGDSIYYDSGNVGIGTGSSPATPLHIKNATGETQLRIQAAEVGEASTLQFFDYLNAEVAEIYGAADDSLRFQAGNQDILTLESSGYAGLGTTDPNTLFHIKNATAETQLRIQAGGVGSAATLQLFDSTNTEIAEIYSAADDSLRFQAGNQDRLTIEDRGYVGIGTASPGTLLQLENATGDTELRLVPGDATSSGTIQFYNSTNEAAEIYNSWTDDSLRFQTADQDRVTIDNSGQVGIGTASPQNELNVIGDGNFTGVVYRNEKALIDWSEAMNGTLFLTSQWNATNTSYYLATNPFAFYNSTSLTMPVIQALNFYNTTETDAQDLTYNNSIASYTNSEDVRYNNSMATYVNALNVSQGSWATNTFATIDEPLWSANLTAHNSTWTTTDSEIWTVVANDTFVPYTGANSNVVLGNNNLSVGGTDFFVDNNNGRVGIGTSNPSKLLEVDGEGLFNDDLTISNAGSSVFRINNTGASQSWIQYVGSNDDYIIRDETDARTLLKFDGAGVSSFTGGNVGIGTDSPERKLVVYNATIPIFQLANSATGVTSTDGFQAQLVASDTYIYNYENGFMSFGTNNAQILKLHASGGVSIGGNYISNDPGDENLIVSGNVGIGTTNPQNLLNVDGDANITGTLYYGSLGTTIDDAFVNVAGDTMTGALNLSSINENNYGNLTVDSGTLFVDSTNDRIGIGTSSPEQLLHLYESTEEVVQRIETDGTNNAYIQFVTDGDGTERGARIGVDYSDSVLRLNYGTAFDGTNNGIAIDSSGNVGIGTTSPTNKLHVASSARFGGYLETTETGELLFNEYYSDGYKHRAEGFVGGITFTNVGDMNFHNGPSQVADTAAARNIGMTLDVTGNVGIGTTSPGVPLDVVEDDATTDGPVIVGRLTHSTSGTAANGIGTRLSFQSEDDGGTISTMGYVQQIFTNVSDGAEESAMSFWTRNAGSITEKMTIDSSGNVGIGTTGPGDKLVVDVGATDSTGISIDGSSNPTLRIDASTGSSGTGNANIVLVNDNSDTTQISMARSGTASDQMRFTGATGGYYFADGNMGIGTANPEGKTHIMTANMTSSPTPNSGADELILEGSGHSGMTITSGTGSQGKIAFGDDNHDIGRIIYDHSVNDLGLWTAGSEALTIDSSQRVGIGTTSPQSKLEVDGDINISKTSTNRLILPQENDAATPTISFGDGNTGFYESSDNNLRVSTGGSNNFLFTGTSFRGANSAGPVILNEAATTTNPTLIPNLADLDTGIGGSGTNQLSLIAGGTEMIRLTNSSGQVDIGGTWQDGGVSISDGTIYATNLSVANITYLNVTHININGSLLPQEGYDNTFDLGNSSDRWNELYLGGNAYINGTVYADAFYNSSGSSIDDIYVNEAGDTMTGNLGINANLTVDTNVFFVDSASDQVGIGTSNPGTKLEVLGEARVTDYFSAGGTAPSPSFYVEDAGDVGIGTANPEYNLDVVDVTDFVVDIDDAGTTTRIGTAGAYNLSFVTGRDTPSGSTRMTIEDGDGEAIRVDDSNNVGIGTSSPAKLLTLKVDEELGWEYTSESGTSYHTIRGGGANPLIFRTSFTASDPTPIFQFNGSDSAKMTILQGGNVGIGTTTPANPLQVVGSIKWGSATAGQQGILSHNVANDYVVIGTSDTADLRFTTSGTDRVIIKQTTGNVGIGTTSPVGNLNINSTAPVVRIDSLSGNDAILALRHDAATGNNEQYFLKYDGTANGFALRGSNIDGSNTDGDIITVADGTDDVIIPTGKIGIGIASPTGTLEVQSADIVDSALGSGAVQGRFLTTDSAALGKGGVITLGGSYTGTTKTGFGSIRGELTALDGQQNGELSFFTNLAGTGMTEKMRIDNNGNVGIGTSSPIANLNVKATTDQNFVVDGNYSFDDGIMIKSVNDANSALKSMELRASQFALQGGNVGIGTSSPSAPLNVESSVSGDWVSVLTNTHTTNGRGLLIQAGDSNDELSFLVQDYNGANSLFAVKGGGKVGIGTTSPQNDLELYSSSAGGSTFRIRGDNADNNYIRLTESAVEANNQGGYIHLAGNENKVYFGTQHSSDDGGADRPLITMTYGGTGYVGINTTNPQQELNVVGEINVTAVDNDISMFMEGGMLVIEG